MFRCQICARSCIARPPHATCKPWLASSDRIYLLSLSLALFIARNWSCAKRRCILLQRLWIAMEIYDFASKILSIDTGRRKYHIVSKINWAALSTDSIEANSFFSFKTSSLTLKRLVVSCRARAVGPEVLHIFKLKKIRMTDWSLLNWLKIEDWLFGGISMVTAVCFIFIFYTCFETQTNNVYQTQN